MSCDCVLNKYIFVLVLCVSSEGYKESGFKELKAPETVYYKKNDIMHATAIIKNVPEDKHYKGCIYNAKRILSTTALTEKMVVYLDESFGKSRDDYTYHIKFGTEDGLECEPVKILTASYQGKRSSNMCIQNNACNITVDLNSTCEKENFTLKLDVITSKLKDFTDNVIRYNVGDKLKLLCSEKTRNKRILLQWHYSNTFSSESVAWNTSDTRTIYNLYLEMDLKEIDDNTFVYCSVNSSGRIVQSSDGYRLKLIEERNSIENLKAVYLNSDVNLIDRDCGTDNEQTKYVKNGTVLYCVYYERYERNAKENEFIIKRVTYNETIYYIYENEVQSTSVGIIIGVCIAIALIIIAIISFSLYRRRQRRGVLQNTVTYSTANEIVYAQLVMPESSSSRPRVEMDASPYAEVIGVLALKSEGKKISK